MLRATLKRKLAMPFDLQRGPDFPASSFALRTRPLDLSDCRSCCGRLN